LHSASFVKFRFLWKIRSGEIKVMMGQLALSWKVCKFQDIFIVSKALKRIILTVILFLIMLTTSLRAGFKEDLSWYASGNGGVVAAGAQTSTLAGIEMLKNGGNAVDAAVATIFNLAVSDYGLFCIGGEVPFMFYSSKTRDVIVFNGMGGAPGDPKAIQWCYAHGIPSTGIKAATVPSAVSTLLAALEQKGTMSFEMIIGSTLSLLDAGGETWYPSLAATLRKLVLTEKSTKGTREQKIRAARDRFYKGDIADELNKYYISSGGFLRKADLEAHKTIVEKPVSIQYDGYTVNKCSTWTQGPVLLQSLRLLENFDLKSMGFFSPDYIHVTIEAMKLAYADRDKYYGDPSFVTVPVKQLLSDEYTKIRYPLIDMKHASKLIRPGDPFRMEAYSGPGQYWPGEKGTSTCVVADRWGNVVAATPSANPDYGICESLGIAHNTRLSSLNTQEGHPNSLQPGKRPRITLTPTIILKDGNPFLAISVVGGDMQDQVSLQLFLDVAEFGLIPKEAVTSPRFLTKHIQDSFNPSPDPSIRMGIITGVDINSTDNALISNLEGRGHKITSTDATLAWPVMIYLDQSTGISYGAGQPSENIYGRSCAAINLTK
jgi:gamma-glutamyltranspeptidase / glutathione hydrolase